VAEAGELLKLANAFAEAAEKCERGHEFDSLAQIFDVGGSVRGS
jgi:hypothetical protein